jgi:hypothetical protein
MLRRNVWNYDNLIFSNGCKTCSLTRAAEKMHVSQSTITLSIKKPEDELAMLLFDRSLKQLSLTTEGVVFLQELRGHRSFGVYHGKCRPQPKAMI